MHLIQIPRPLRKMFGVFLKCKRLLQAVNSLVRLAISRPEDLLAFTDYSTEYVQL